MRIYSHKGFTLTRPLSEPPQTGSRRGHGVGRVGGIPYVYVSILHVLGYDVGYIIM